MQNVFRTNVDHCFEDIEIIVLSVICLLAVNFVIDIQVSKAGNTFYIWTD